MAGAKRPATRNLPLHSTCSLLLATVFLPLLVAVCQNKITARYNSANQIADVEGIGELKLASHCSLLRA